MAPKQSFVVTSSRSQIFRHNQIDIATKMVTIQRKSVFIAGGVKRFPAISR